MDSEASGNNTMKYFMGSNPNYDQLRAAALSHATQVATVQQRSLDEAVRHGIAMTAAGLKAFAQEWKSVAGSLFSSDPARKMPLVEQISVQPKQAELKRDDAPTMADRLPAIVALDMVRGAEPLKPTMDAIVAKIKENPARVPALAMMMDAASDSDSGLQRWGQDVMSDVSGQLADQYASMVQELTDAGVIQTQQSRQSARAPRQSY